MALLLMPVLLLAAGWLILYLLLTCRRGHRAWDVLLHYRYAHRGYHDKPHIPENSMAAFRRAAARGWGAELDIHLMKDGNLAVIHDASLRRTAGADVYIEDLTRKDLEKYRLEGTDERIPLLEEVLALFEGRAPLIVELKAERGNHAALSEAAARRLDAYKGDFCIESFDPRVVLWFRKHRSHYCRGQLSQNFFRDRGSKLSWPLKFVLTNLLTNGLTRPDFVAYNFDHRDSLCLRACLCWHRAVEFSWTVRTRAHLEQAEAAGSHCIFECFDPEA